MNEQTVFGVVVLILTLGTLVGLGVSTGSDPDVVIQSDEADRSVNMTSTGVKYTVHPSELIQGCPGGKDCIPSIDNPRFESASEATWLRSDDLVIGVEVDGQTKAYPLRILNVHEIVNDEIAGRPIAVTYCPLCRSGLVFSRNVNGSTLTFGVSGKLLDANLVMYDRQSETYWSQITGEAIVGSLVPHKLMLQPSTITTWEKWQSAHSETIVLSRDTGVFPPETYGTNPYAGYQESDRVGFGVDQADSRLPAKELVYGVTVGGESRAYPEAGVLEKEIIHDEVDDVPILIVANPQDDSVAVFIRQIGNQTLTFERSEKGLVDKKGNLWSFDGTAQDGNQAGDQLDRINTHSFFWFAWSNFHPDTSVYDTSQ